MPAKRDAISLALPDWLMLLAAGFQFARVGGKTTAALP